MSPRFALVIALVLGSIGAGIFIVIQAQSRAEVERQRAVEQAHEARRNAKRLDEARAAVDGYLDRASSRDDASQGAPAPASSLPPHRDALPEALPEALADRALVAAIDRLAAEVAHTRQTLDSRLQAIERTLAASSDVLPEDAGLDWLLARKEVESIATEITEMRSRIMNALEQARAGNIDDSIDVATLEEMLSELHAIEAVEQYAAWRARWRHIVQ